MVKLEVLGSLEIRNRRYESKRNIWAGGSWREKLYNRNSRENPIDKD